MHAHAHGWRAPLQRRRAPIRQRLGPRATISARRRSRRRRRRVPRRRQRCRRRRRRRSIGHRHRRTGPRGRLLATQRERRERRGVASSRGSVGSRPDERVRADVDDDGRLPRVRSPRRPGGAALVVGRMLPRGGGDREAPERGDVRVADVRVHGRRGRGGGWELRERDGDDAVDGGAGGVGGDRRSRVREHVRGSLRVARLVRVVRRRRTVRVVPGRRRHVSAGVGRVDVRGDDG